MLLIDFPNNGRLLTSFIKGLLRSGAAIEVKRINYVKSYKVVDNSIEKTEQKLLLIDFLPEKKEQLETMIKKMHPQGDVVVFRYGSM